MSERTPERRLHDLQQVLAMLLAHGLLIEGCINHQGAPRYDDLQSILADHDVDLDVDMCIPGFFLTEELLALWMGVELHDKAVDLDEAAEEAIRDLEDMLSFTAEAFGQSTEPTDEPTDDDPDPPSRANYWGEEERQADDEGEALEPALEWVPPSDCGDHRYDEWHIRVTLLETQTEYAAIDPDMVGCRAWRVDDDEDHETVYQTALAYLRSKEKSDAEEA